MSVECREPLSVALDGLHHVHLLGIGGIGVSAVARLLLARGIAVSGSDVRESSITTTLRAEGATVFIGHGPDNPAGADLVVRSTAIPRANQELLAARSAGMTVVHRSVVLAALMRERRSVGVTGTNGKGTVSAMIAYLLDAAGLSPSFAIGGLLLNYGTNARWTGGRHIVCELDESDGSFTNTRPDCLVVNNLEADHLNYYSDLEGLLSTFRAYLSRPEAPVRIHGCGDDANFRTVCVASGREAVTYGESGSCTFRVSSVSPEGRGFRFRLAGPDGGLGEFAISLPGHYNVVNAAGAISVALAEGADTERLRAAMPGFLGLENRFTVVDRGRFTVVKDYISHPTGIRGVLRGARVFAKGRVIAVFKPYRFTMINYLKDEYGTAFADADITLITETYPAGEVPIPGVGSEMLVERIGSAGSDARLVPEMERIPDTLHALVREGDTVVFFGGDDLFRVADVFSRKL